MFFLKKEITWICFLIFVSLITGLFWAISYWSQPLGSDEAGYNDIAGNLCRVHLFSQTITGHQELTMIQPPFYSFLMSIFYCSFSNNQNLVRILQVLLFVGIVILVYFIARLVFNQRVATFASLLTAIFPPIGSFTGLIFTEITFIFPLNKLV